MLSFCLLLFVAPPAPESVSVPQVDPQRELRERISALERWKWEHELEDRYRNARGLMWSGTLFSFVSAGIFTIGVPLGVGKLARAQSDLDLCPDAYCTDEHEDLRKEKISLGLLSTAGIFSTIAGSTLLGVGIHRFNKAEIEAVGLSPMGRGAAFSLRVRF